MIDSVLRNLIKLVGKYRPSHSPRIPDSPLPHTPPEGDAQIVDGVKFLKSHQRELLVFCPIREALEIQEALEPEESLEDRYVSQFLLEILKFNHDLV